MLSRAGFIVDGKSGTGLGSPNFHTFPTGNYSLPGTPKIYFNAYAIYKTPWGLGFGIGPQVTGEQKANLSGTLKIPAQVTWNAEIFYRQPCWEVQVNVYNFTNERKFHRDRSDLYWQRRDPAANAVSRLGLIQDQVLVHDAAVDSATFARSLRGLSDFGVCPEGTLRK